MSRRLARVLALALLSAVLGACDDGLLELSVLFRGELSLPAGTERSGTVVVLDGDVVVEAGARLEGPLVVLGGSARVDGELGGDLIGLAGAVTLGPSARVAGEVSVAGSLERDPGATVVGVVTVGPAVSARWSEQLRSGPVGWRGLLGRALGLALLVVALARYAPRAASRLEAALLHHPLPALAVGLLALVVGIVLVVVMAFTVVLIPVSVVALVAGVASVVAGWTVVGLACASLLRRRWRPGGASATAGRWLAAAAAGALVGLALGLLEHVPLVGGAVALVATALGLGALLVTGFGARRFVPDVLRE